MSRTLWDRYREYLNVNPSIELTLDPSRMKFPADFFAKMEPAMQKAYQTMDALEKGAIANPDEKRMVGHYWLRAPQLAPTPELPQRDRRRRWRDQGVRGATCTPAQSSRPKAARSRTLLVIGIGGSALGPQFVARRRWAAARDKLQRALLRQHRSRRHGPRLGRARRASSTRR